MKFRKRVRLFPGVTLNFSKTGISTTFGVPGLSVNVNKNGMFMNTGLPGTGFYDRKRIGEPKKNIPSSQPSSDIEEQKRDSEQNTELKSIENLEEITTVGLQQLRETLLTCYQERNELIREITETKAKLKSSQNLLILSYLFIFGFFIKKFKQNRDELEDYLTDLEKQLSECYVNIDINTDENIEKSFLELLESYKTLLTCQKIWDITSTSNIDKSGSRSAASVVITRKPVKFDFGNLNIIKSKFKALHFENANGGDLYIYPAFIAIVDKNQKFGLLDIREVEFNFNSQNFMEEGEIPTDAKITGKTWAKVNKNGTPDKRYKDNYQIPICTYGCIEIKSSTGLNEAYCFSNYDKAEKFFSQFKNYQKTILE